MLLVLLVAAPLILEPSQACHFGQRPAVALASRPEYAIPDLCPCGIPQGLVVASILCTFGVLHALTLQRHTGH